MNHEILLVYNYKKKKLEKIKKLKFLNLFDFKKKSLNADC